MSYEDQYDDAPLRAPDPAFDEPETAPVAVALPDDVRALSVTRPWPEMILRCGKDVESRSWWTRYRGPLLIHAAQSWNGTATDWMEDLEVKLDRDLDRDLGVVSRHAADHPTGIVGLVDLVYVCTVQRKGGHECHCGPWAMPGLSHWRLANPCALAEPVSWCRGAFGLWRPDAEVVAAVAMQLGMEMEAPTWVT